MPSQAMFPRNLFWHKQFWLSRYVWQFLIPTSCPKQFPKHTLLTPTSYIVILNYQVNAHERILLLCRTSTDEVTVMLAGSTAVSCSQAFPQSLWYCSVVVYARTPILASELSEGIDPCLSLICSETLIQFTFHTIEVSQFLMLKNLIRQEKLTEIHTVIVIVYFMSFFILANCTNSPFPRRGASTQRPGRRLTVGSIVVSQNHTTRGLVLPLPTLCP